MQFAALHRGTMCTLAADDPRSCRVGNRARASVGLKELMASSSPMISPTFQGLRLLIQLVPPPRYPQPAVIVLSKSPIPRMAELATNNGAQAYMVKSEVTPDQLEVAIRKAITDVSATRNASRR